MTTDVAIQLARRRRSNSGLFVGLGMAMAVVCVASLSIGSVPLTLGDLWAVFTGAARGSLAHDVVWSIRMPRTLLGMVTGAALACSGAALQGLFRNPLVEPGFVGVSTGAALAAAVTIVFAARIVGPGGVPELLPPAAFLGALVAVGTAWRIGSSGGSTRIAALILAGIGISAIAAAGIGALTLVASDSELRDITFWSLGSLNGATWHRLALSAPWSLAAVLLIQRAGASLDAMTLGEAQAGHLGVRVERVKRQLIVLTALAVGATVAVTGVIGFVGLVVPHVLRLIRGPNHRVLLPAAALLGAVGLVLADLVARTVVAPTELPIGVVTAICGGPFFLWLIVDRQRRGGLR